MHAATTSCFCGQTLIMCCITENGLHQPLADGDYRSNDTKKVKSGRKLRSQRKPTIYMAVPRDKLCKQQNLAVVCVLTQQVKEPHHRTKHAKHARAIETPRHPLTGRQDRGKQKTKQWRPRTYCIVPRKTYLTVGKKTHTLTHTKQGP